MHRYVIDLALDIARIVVLLIIYLRLQLYLAQRRCASLDELCHNEMSRDHDAPLEYLRILASLKLRFGLATLVTAHGALPVCSPMVALDTQLPNGYVGRRAFPMEAEGRLADFDRRIHPSQSWSPSASYTIYGRLPTV